MRNRLLVIGVLITLLIVAGLVYLAREASTVRMENINVYVDLAPTATLGAGEVYVYMDSGINYSHEFMADIYQPWAWINITGLTHPVEVRVITNNGGLCSSTISLTNKSLNCEPEYTQQYVSEVEIQVKGCTDDGNFHPVSDLIVAGSWSLNGPVKITCP